MKIETVAILSTGEMGHSVAAVLKNPGLNVVTCLKGRSERTVRYAAKAGVSDLPTLEAVVAAADVIISIVVPSGAKPVAEAVAKVLSEQKKPLLYVDANAISAATAASIEGIIVPAGGRFADACIIGGASKVGKTTVMFVSGAHAADFAELNNFGLIVEILGDKAGQASAFKIVYAGLTKGLASLMLEQLLVAHSLGILDKISDQYRAKFPDIMKTVDESFPGIPFRAARRSEEMEELCNTIEEAGMTPIMASASQRMLASVGALNLRAEFTDADEEKWDAKDVIALLCQRLTKKSPPTPLFQRGDEEGIHTYE